VIGVYAGTPLGGALAARLASDGRVVRVARSPEEARALKEPRLVVVDAAPAKLREVARSLGEILDGGHLVVHAVRGLLPDGARASEAIHDETAVRRIGVLAGPLWARELEAARPSAAVVASRHPEVVDEFSVELSTPHLRIYRGRDPLGIELASAITDLIVAGVGVARALGLDETAGAILIVRAIRELGRLIEALGGDPQSASGMAGLGDVLVRTRAESAPFQLGVRVGNGDAQARSELAPAARAVAALARAVKRPAHVFAGLIALVDGEVTPQELVGRLMTIPILDE
jgi:glycerol-3-phosphate dehydrogenase (NAD(P)+)